MYLCQLFSCKGATWIQNYPDIYFSNSCVQLHKNNAYQFIGVFGPGEVAHLWPRVHALQWLAGERIPESYTPVGCASPASQQPVLVGRPGDGLHGRQVVRVGLHGRYIVHVPHKQLIVIAPRGQVLVVRWPLQPTHFLSVASEPPLWGHGRRSDVALEDQPVSAARRQHVTIPRQGP